MNETRPSDRDGERRLGKIYRTLSPQDRTTLLAFAQFLAVRESPETRREEEPLEPEAIPRPDGESVVGAIKRLSRKYYMIDRSAMLNDTSTLVSAHVLQGRPATEVIDELEILFDRQYARYREEIEKQGT